jgi:hypothetical protein
LTLPLHIRAPLNLSAFPITLTEDSAMAAGAMIELHLLDTGHFALEDASRLWRHLTPVVPLMSRNGRWFDPPLQDHIGVGGI